MVLGGPVAQPSLYSRSAGLEFDKSYKKNFSTDFLHVIPNSFAEGGRERDRTMSVELRRRIWDGDRDCHDYGPIEVDVRSLSHAPAWVRDDIILGVLRRGPKGPLFHV